MPGHAIARAGNAQPRHQRDIRFPPPVMIRQLIFVEHAPGSRMRSGDERVFNTRRPQKGARRSELIEFRCARKHQAQFIDADAAANGSPARGLPRCGTTGSAGANPMAQERRSSKASSVSSPRVVRELPHSRAHARACSGAPAPTLTLKIGVGSAAPDASRSGCKESRTTADCRVGAVSNEIHKEMAKRTADSWPCAPSGQRAFFWIASMREELGFFLQ